MRWYTSPLVDGARPFRRALQALATFLLHPRYATASWRASRWTHRISALTVMQQMDNRISFRYGRR